MFTLNCIKKRFILVTLLFSTLLGCGFHLRGAYTISSEFKNLRLQPSTPFDPFQKLLRRALKTNEINIIEEDTNPAIKACVLVILNQNFSEQITAYGSDGQANRAMLRFQMTYQLLNSDGTLIVDNGQIQVQRELSINPNALLSTENERSRIKNELCSDAALQFMRQLSAFTQRRGVS